MKEIRRIISAFEKLDRSGEYGILASVVYTSGSTYRRPGARAFILPDDTMLGLVGGGCLEADLLVQARQVRDTGRTKRIHYDNTSDADIIWGLGLGCAGVVDVLLERVSHKHPGPIEFMAQCIRDRRPGVLATVVRCEAADDERLGAKWMRHPDGSTNTMGEWAPPESLVAEAAQVLTEGKGKLIIDNSLEILLERITPIIRLVVFGAGADAVPVVRIAAELGWEIAVVDHRPNFAQAERFPEAGFVAQYRAEQAASRLTLDNNTVALLMTHNYLQDRDLLRFLLSSAARYIGVLGPKRRLGQLLDDFRKEGFIPTEAQLSRVYGPAGFDIGAESPEEIALTILAEIQSALNHRSGSSLRDRNGPIHG